MKTLVIQLSFLLFSTVILAQNLSGKWSGELSQQGKSTSFFYELDLQQSGENISGEAFSRSPDGKTAARFEVGGIWDGTVLTLQEVRQIEPPDAPWCLKHIRLQLAERSGVAQLEGTWEAEGCTPGTLSLKNKAFFFSKSPVVSSLAPHPLFLGKWAGHLTQSDREHGFYFEINLAADGTGTSQIISDGAGGNATHDLRWAFDNMSSFLTFEETGIAQKSIADWRWCLKNARLKFEKETVRLSLQGDWQGYLEGHSAQNGACAPGKLYLEKPLPETAPGEPGNPATLTQAPDIQAYQKNLERKVDVERVLEVKSKTLRIKVWDSGTVDGDVLTLFLNGEQLLKNYRVTRNKNETIVQLEKPVNYLILHAINLGSISPNTVAVSVDDGVTEQMVIISSNLKESGAVMIREFSMK